MRIVSVLGARPQFIKHAPTCRALKAVGIEDIIIHTGQHYDRQMSDLFFEELGIPPAAYNLGIGSAGHGAQTGAMLARLEELFIELKPDLVIVHGDTNSTLAGALAAAKLDIPVAHNEAGMRSYNRSMPEEINRVLTDHCSSLLFCPTQSAANLLKQEGIVAGVHVVGDVLYDVAVQNRNDKNAQSKVLKRLDVERGGYLLLTLHRPYTVDDPVKLKALLETLGSVGEQVLFPMHPRTKTNLGKFGMNCPDNFIICEPLGYLEMAAVEAGARIILTDSGGVQKEAYFYGVPCVTLRPETEWVETVEAGWNIVVDTDRQKILEAVVTKWWPEARPELFGDGHAAERIAEIIAASGVT